MQIPKLIRWHYKLEPSQILQVTVNHPNASGSKEQYLTRMGKDGRITVPKLILTILMGNRSNQGAYLLKVTLEPS